MGYFGKLGSTPSLFLEQVTLNTLMSLVKNAWEANLVKAQV